MNTPGVQPGEVAIDPWAPRQSSRSRRLPACLSNPEQRSMPVPQIYKSVGAAFPARAASSLPAGVSLTLKLQAVPRRPRFAVAPFHEDSARFDF